MNRKYLTLLILFALAALFLVQPQQESYSVSASGILSYSIRPAPDYTVLSEVTENNARIIRISFESHGKTIFGLLSVPKSSQTLPAFFLVPGVSVNKEYEQETLGSDLNELGFAVLSLDRRGEGETGGPETPVEVDYQAFLKGEETFQHKMVYDCLRAYDILSSRPEIDPSRIYAGGESLGARLALIAAATEPKIAGVLMVSSSGYGFASQQDRELSRFLGSFDPDNYLPLLEGRPLAMLHSEKDDVVPYEMARRTFDKALPPKRFFTTQSSKHAYVREDMKPLLPDILGFLESQRKP